MTVPKTQGYSASSLNLTLFFYADCSFYATVNYCCLLSTSYIICCYVLILCDLILMVYIVNVYFPTYICVINMLCILKQTQKFSNIIYVCKRELAWRVRLEVTDNTFIVCHLQSYRSGQFCFTHVYDIRKLLCLFQCQRYSQFLYLLLAAGMLSAEGQRQCRLSFSSWRNIILNERVHCIEWFPSGYRMCVQLRGRPDRRLQLTSACTWHRGRLTGQVCTTCSES